MIFKRAAQRYGRTPEPDTPFQRAGQLWDERIGSARVQAQSWRLMSFGGLFLSATLGGGLIWQSLQSRVVPYVVEVDRLGAARSIAVAGTDYQPTDPQIEWHLAKFIENVRSLSLDPVLVRERWLAAYDYSTDRGALFLSEYARAANPFAEVGQKTVSVQIVSVVRASDTSFQVKWRESEYERGSLARTSEWTAILTVKVKTPRSVEILRKNPLGLYVDAIAWSRELETIIAPEEGLSPPVSLDQPAPQSEPASALDDARAPTPSETSERTSP
ncbi:MAG: type IV secretory pathway TrbF-like protein [Parasphingorhabdus sp.]|jgi:type IV secretory pathway TrbF-like protein|uniref:conjugal transfer protein TrbF n=1 Tax=Parasphingorhabdus sp. TaxID=2709688 RepID=UPI0039E5ED63